jgi:hypothetical protein
LKNGDKIFCKKIYNPDGIHYYFTVGKMYRVCKMTDKYIQEIEDDNIVYSVYLQSDDNTKNAYIWKYFYTEKELRKLKLEKLCVKTSPSIINALSNLNPMWATTREIGGIFYEGNLNKGNKLE